MTGVTRPIATLTEELHRTPYWRYGMRLRLGIERYIAELPRKEQAAAWQQLPYLVQFGPILVKYGKHLPDIRRVNPGIEYGGLTEYNKTAIHHHVPATYLLKTKDIDTPEHYTHEDIHDIIETHIQYPCMIKAQKGERGVGIYFIADQQALIHHRNKRQTGVVQREPLSLQAFSTRSEEYCLQFYQYYDQANIHRIVFGGLTLRDIPRVIGDGIHTVHEHILTLPLAEHHRATIIHTLQHIQPTILSKIPKPKESVQIVYTASIDYGTMYRTIHLDEEQHDACLTLLKKLLVSMPPEYMSVGRFDIKADSLDTLLAGQLDIIECNAGGGIPTHVYSAHMSIAEKYAELDKHFGIMEHIGFFNKQKYARFKDKLGSRPQMLAVSYTSIAKKGITLFGTSNEKTQNIKNIYKDIFRILRGSRRARRKKRIHHLFVG